MRCRLAAVPLLLLAFVASRAGAQEETIGTPYWVSTPSAARAALDEATGAVANRDWSGAARALQKVFDNFPNSFLATGDPDQYVGARRRAVELLASMPAAVRNEYQRIYGPEADDALRQGLANHSRALLVAVVRRFEATKAGLSAILALADRAILHGQPAEARLLLARLSRLHPEALATDGVKRRLALAAAQDHAEGGPPPNAAESAVPSPSFPPSEPDAWPMLGGCAPRNGVAAPALFREERSARELDIRARPYDRPRIPAVRYSFPRGDLGRDFEDYWRVYAPVHPVIARGLLVYSDGRRLFAVNLYTGELQWEFPRRLDLEPGGRTNLSNLFTPVVADGVVYASLEIPVRYSPQSLQGIPITYYIPTRRLVAVEMETGKVLWSHRDGAALQGIAGADTLSKVSVTGAPLVRGDRLYVGAAYSEGTYHTMLLAVDRHTGDLVYATRISNGQQELNLFGRQLQECVPTPVAESDGVLYYGTNLGVVAAVDALLGSPLWARTYAVAPIPSTYLWYVAPRRWPPHDNGPPIVDDATLLIAPADGVNLLALDRATGKPRWKVRAEDDPYTSHMEVRTLQAADADRVYVSGANGFLALRLEDGRPAWIRRLPVTENPDLAAGRGLLAQNGLWLPTEQAIYHIDPKSGKVLDEFARVPPDKDAGTAVNLVWGDGVLVAAGRDVLTVRYDEKDVLRLAKERVAKSPGETGPLLSAGDVYLAENRTALAVDSYRRALDLARASGAEAAKERARKGLFRALLAQAKEALDTAPQFAQAAFDKAVAAAPDDSDALRARMQLEQDLAARDRPKDADWRLANLTQIEQTFGDRPYPGEGGGSTMRGWALKRMAAILAAIHEAPRALDVLQKLLLADPTSQDAQHAAAQIDSILKQKGRGVYKTYEERAAKLFKKSFDKGNLDAVEHGLLLYPNAEASVDATLELAGKWIDRGKADPATNLLLRFLVAHRHPGDAHAAAVPDALLLLVRALEARRSYGTAYEALQQLKTQYGDALVDREDGARVPARVVAEEWLKKPPYPEIGKNPSRRDLEPELTRRFELDLGKQLGADGAYVDVPDLSGQIPDALRNAVLLSVRDKIAALDARTGKTRYVLDLDRGQPLGPLVLESGRLHVLTDEYLYVFDAKSGRTVAREAIPGHGTGKRLLEHRRQVFFVSKFPGETGQVGIAAVHPRDGTLLWWRRLPIDADSEQVDFNLTSVVANRLLVFSQLPPRVSFVNSTTGALEGRVTLPVPDGDHPQIESAEPLGDGRVLLALSSGKRPISGFTWERSYRIELIDATRDADRSLLWAQDFHGRTDAVHLATAYAVANHIVAVDDTGYAVVFDMDGNVVKSGSATAPLHLAAGEGSHDLARVQPRHDSLLLILTRPSARSDEPAYLAALEVPDLRLRYKVQVGERGTDMVDVDDSRGVLAFSLLSSDQRMVPGKIRLYDPLTGRNLQDIDPPPADFLNVKVQNGFLLLTNTGMVYLYGPK